MKCECGHLKEEHFYLPGTRIVHEDGSGYCMDGWKGTDVSDYCMCKKFISFLDIVKEMRDAEVRNGN